MAANDNGIEKLTRELLDELKGEFVSPDNTEITLDAVVRAKLKKLKEVYVRYGALHAQLRLPMDVDQMMQDQLITQIDRFKEGQESFFQELFIPNEKFGNVLKRLDKEIACYEALTKDIEAIVQENKKENCDGEISRMVSEPQNKTEELISNQNQRMNQPQVWPMEFINDIENKKNKFITEIAVNEIVLNKFDRLKCLYSVYGQLHAQLGLYINVDEMIQDQLITQVNKFEEEQGNIFQDLIMPNEKFENVLKRLDKEIACYKALVKDISIIISNHKKEEGNEASRIVEQQETKVEALERAQNKLDKDLLKAEQSLASLPPPPQPHSRAFSNADRISFFTHSEGSVVRTPSLSGGSFARKSDSAAVQTPGLSRRSLSIKIGSD